jgi:hypothetical protein
VEITEILKAHKQQSRVTGLNQPTRGLQILIAPLTAINHNRIFLLCHYFATKKQLWENESRHLGQNEMAGLKGKSGPPGNMNAFKHGLAAIQKRREEAVTTEYEENVRQQIIDGLIAHKGRISRYRRPPGF